MEEIKTDMQFTDHVSFQERGKLIKRVTAVILLLFVIGALFGAFGFAGWTKKRKGNGTDLEVLYESILRANKSTVMRFTLIILIQLI
ncbi:MAG: hypothetical protein JWO32_2359 [Bacteroidetes bacterium]|nr:hypothetical protein [Bacteroidota bacterium]